MAMKNVPSWLSRNVCVTSQLAACRRWKTQHAGSVCRCYDVRFEKHHQKGKDCVDVGSFTKWSLTEAPTFRKLFLLHIQCKSPTTRFNPRSPQTDRKKERQTVWHRPFPPLKFRVICAFYFWLSWLFAWSRRPSVNTATRCTGMTSD